MKYKWFIVILLVLLSNQTSSQNTPAQAYSIEVNAPTQAGSMAYLASYWEDKTYILDSMMISDNGEFTFSQEKQLLTGQYLLYIKPDIQLNLLLDKDEQSNIKISIAEDIVSSKITGSTDTELFWKYIIDRNQQNAESEILINKIKASSANKMPIQNLIEEYIKLTKEIDQYTAQQISKHQGSWYSAYIRAQKPILAPYTYPTSKEEIASNASYISEHYFDNVDFTDTRMWNTNFFVNYMDTYLTEWIPQYIDTISSRVSWIVSQAKPNDLAFERTLSYFTNESMKSKVMGEENIWAKLAEDYIFDKDLKWINSEQYTNLQAEYELIKLNRIGMKAQNLELVTADGGAIQIEDIEADYTILYFYSTNCHFCRTEIPLLKTAVLDANKEKSVKVIAVNLEQDLPNWKEFIAEKEIQDWINAADPNFKSEYWTKYNTQGTPSLYLLDKNKKIVAKKINVETLVKLFDRIK